MGRRRDTPDFVRSCQIASVSFQSTAEERALARALLRAEAAGEREALGQRLLNSIGRRYRLPAIRLRVGDKPQPHKMRGGVLAYKEYGVYYLEDNAIRIANRTAVREKVVAGKTFFDTLIHEFMHHFDRKHLRIPSTPHSPGFYSRIEEMKRALAGPPARRAAAPRKAAAPSWPEPPKHLIASLDRARAEDRRGGGEGALRPAGSAPSGPEESNPPPLRGEGAVGGVPAPSRGNRRPRQLSLDFDEAPA